MVSGVTRLTGLLAAFENRTRQIKAKQCRQLLGRIEGSFRMRPKDGRDQLQAGKRQVLAAAFTPDDQSIVRSSPARHRGERRH